MYVLCSQFVVVAAAARRLIEPVCGSGVVSCVAPDSVDWEMRSGVRDVRISVNHLSR